MSYRHRDYEDWAEQLTRELKHGRGMSVDYGPELNDSAAYWEQYVWHIAGDEGYYFLVVAFEEDPIGSPVAADGALFGPFDTIQYMEAHATEDAPGSALRVPTGRLAELADLIVKVVGRGAPPAAAPGAALDAVNRHRRKTGQRELDPAAAGWTPEDVELEAQRISRLNPEQVELKRRLMR